VGRQKQIGGAGQVLECEFEEQRFARIACLEQPLDFAVIAVALRNRIVEDGRSPVTEKSSIYFLSVPLSSMSRVMSSIHRLWPRSCRAFVGFTGLSPL